MRTILIAGHLFLLSIFTLSGQSRKELEEQRKKTLQEIEYVGNILKQTEKQKITGLNELKVLGSKVELHEKVIKNLNEEADLLQMRVELNNLAISLMQNDLESIKKEYEKAILNAYKASKGYPYMVYVLSARDFNQGYRRIKYIQDISRFRRNEAELIADLKKQIEKTKIKLSEDFIALNNLRQDEEKQKNILKEEQEKKRKMVTTLSGKEKQLRGELEAKRKIAVRIENEINKIIEEERKKSTGTEMTPEMKLISSGFAGNKGRLPWPVEKGVITSQFGLQQHKELTFVKQNNPGIEITSNGKVKVRSIFTGEVARILTISGENMTVIIKHGNYFSVYQNIINVVVKPGQMVDIKQEIGEVYCDESKGNKSILKFMIFRDKEKLNPEEWLAKI